MEPQIPYQFQEAEKIKLFPPPPPKRNITIEDKPIEGTLLDLKADTIIIDKSDNSKVNDPLVIINGQIQDKSILKGKKIITAKVARAFQPNNKEAMKLYGDAAKDGVLVFTDAVIAE